MRYRLLFLLACTVSGQIPNLAENPSVFGLLDDIYSISNNRIFLGKGGDPLFFQNTLDTPQHNVYQLNFRVDEMDLTKSTFGDSLLHLPCKPTFTCVWRNTFEGSTENPGNVLRTEKFNALDVTVETMNIAAQVLEDLVKLQNLVTFPVLAHSAAIARPAPPSKSTAIRQGSSQPVASSQQLRVGKEAFEQCAGCHDPAHIAELGKNRDLYTPLDGLFSRAKLRNGRAVTLENVRAAIEKGGRGMPAYKDLLSDDELTDVVLYVRYRFH